MRSSLGKTLVGVTSALAIAAILTTSATATSAAPIPQAVTPTGFTVSQPDHEVQLANDEKLYLTHHTALPEVVTVVGGNTLSKIAAMHCGTSHEWPGIYARNQALIGTNYNELKIGWQLTMSCDPTVAPPAPPITPAPRVVTTAVVTHHVVHSTAHVTHSTFGSVNPSDYSGFQACVIRRESRGNPNVMNASGHYGLYQFSRSTWIAYGGSPATFGHASVAEQNQVFANAMARGGQSNWSPYDHC